MIRLSFYEGANTAEEVRPHIAEEPWQTYLVLKPIFKRGREWQPGEPIDLEPNTARAFIADGSIQQCETKE